MEPSTQHSDPRQGGIVILDFGSQYTQLIARRVRELGVYAEVFPFDAPPETVNQHHPRGYIFSGGPNSIYDEGAPQIPAFILRSGKPELGICYGMQALTYAFGGAVAPAQAREYGPAEITITQESSLFHGLPQEIAVWMSHGDRIERPPEGFVPLAAHETANSPA